ncbi:MULTISPECIES: DUF4362 domain-containing protein [Clostridium]|uniref:DUF4362 domain-containing protein n=1 Tax=Clostridium TaxID=1485 RepID=UPI0008242B87|nr:MULTISPECIES: DUF4362 domain-containing protein [Clostridium]PJI10100.1 DUF4362 domain-containing protein [Clostridium sp. CT7]
MKKYLISAVVVSMLIFSACGRQEEGYSKYGIKNVSKNDTITYSLKDNVNTDRLQKFIDNVSKGIKDRINLVRYTTEGDPIITQLYFNGKYIQIYIDNSKDKFGGANKNEILYNKIKGGKQLKDNLLKYLKDNNITN